MPEEIPEDIIISGLEALNCPKLVEIERERCTGMTVSWMIQILEVCTFLLSLSLFLCVNSMN